MFDPIHINLVREISKYLNWLEFYALRLCGKRYSLLKNRSYKDLIGSHILKKTGFSFKGKFKLWGYCLYQCLTNDDGNMVIRVSDLDQFDISSKKLIEHDYDYYETRSPVHIYHSYGDLVVLGEQYIYDTDYIRFDGHKLEIKYLGQLLTGQCLFRFDQYFKIYGTTREYIDLPKREKIKIRHDPKILNVLKDIRKQRELQKYYKYCKCHENINISIDTTRNTPVVRIEKRDQWICYCGGRYNQNDRTIYEDLKEEEIYREINDWFDKYDYDSYILNPEK